MSDSPAADPDDSRSTPAAETQAEKRDNWMRAALSTTLAVGTALLSLTHDGVGSAAALRIAGIVLAAPTLVWAVRRVAMGRRRVLDIPRVLDIVVLVVAVGYAIIAGAVVAIVAAE